jgi:hypothetical protein
MAAAAFAQNFACIREGEELAFIALPSKNPVKQLSASTDELIRNIGGILEQMLVSAIERRTSADFVAFRDATFPSYAQVMLALGRLVNVIVPKEVLARIVSESFCEMEADFRDNGLLCFGAAIQAQGIFTVWTLRKIADLAQRIANTPKLEGPLQERDGDFCRMFAFHSLRARFHLDCLIIAMRRGLPVYPEVQDVVSDGLRSAVDAYGWIKQGADLRLKLEEAVINPIELDDEDREFLNASAYDMAVEPQ